MLSLHQVTKGYGEQQVLRGLNLQLQQGSFYALLGENGAGKTTTLHTVLGIIKQDSGTIAWEKGLEASQQKIAYVPEVVNLYPELTALETLQLFAEIAANSLSSEQLSRLLTQSGLEESHHRRRVGQFSKGMRQKVALAVAELQQAALLVLDEPTSGLDPLAAEQLMNRLAQLREEGRTILMSTHEVELLERWVDRVGVMKQGQLVAEFSSSDWQQAPMRALYRQALL